MLPILDLRVFIDHEDTENKIEHKFYKKEVANPELIKADAANPREQKIAMLTEEGMRRLRNTHPELPDKVKDD